LCACSMRPCCVEGCLHVPDVVAQTEYPLNLMELPSWVLWCLSSHRLRSALLNSTYAHIQHMLCYVHLSMLVMCRHRHPVLMCVDSSHGQTGRSECMKHDTGFGASTSRKGVGSFRTTQTCHRVATYRGHFILGIPKHLSQVATGRVLLADLHLASCPPDWDIHHTGI
jgi:hypothetical protein